MPPDVLKNESPALMVLGPLIIVQAQLQLLVVSLVDVEVP
jgi:hypothetical protein